MRAGTSLSSASLRVVVIGAGPRGIGIVERLAARRPQGPGILHLVDPHPDGGRVWRQDQSSLLWMNSRCGDVTLLPDESVRTTGPLAVGPTLYDWASRIAPRWCTDPALLAEAGLLKPHSYASRRLCGAYLNWCLRTSLDALSSGWTVVTHAVRARHLRERSDGALDVHLEGGRRLAADRVVLALGNLDGAPSPEQRALGTFAEQHGGRYFPPCYTADLDLSGIPARDPLLVRGLGLAFLDLLILLTEGRGGVFRRDASGVLAYEPSGREPTFIVASRRGLPPRARPAVPPLTPERTAPVLLADAEVRAAAERMTSGGEAGRRAALEELWQAVVREMAWAHYEELFTRDPRAGHMGWEAFAAVLRTTPVESPAWPLLARHISDPADRFVEPGLTPAVLPVMPSADRLTTWMQRHLHTAVRQAGDPRRTTDGAAQQAMVRAVETIIGVLMRERAALDTEARRLVATLAGLARRAAAGAPALRIEQLAALARCGLVRFAGGEPAVATEPTTGTFVLRTRTLPGEEFRAARLVDAWLPDSDAIADASGLLRRSAGDGLVRVTTPATPAHGAKLATCRKTFHVLDGHGTRDDRLVALGDHADSGALGSLSRPHTNAAFFRQNDKVVDWLCAPVEARAGASTRNVPRGADQG
ncbi:FAD/NAD(P)-binding protein [Streptomyces sp. NPDC048650]|uniref:FAD/NAD(P)-binding protein n=1 Tax=Streptomyces sp. NPDC048650 TaxID=3365583 RepID=UPI0037177128